MGWQDAPVVEEGGGAGGQPAWMSAPIVGAEGEAPVIGKAAQPAVEPTDWEMAKESLGQIVRPMPGTEPGTWEYTKGLGREAFLESNPLVNLGAWAIKQVTGQKTEGTLKPAQEPTFMESLKAGTNFMLEHPLTATAELAKGLLYSPELSVMALSKGPQMVEKAAELAKLGRTAREAALLGERAVEGAVVMGGIATVQQAAQKEEVNWGEVGSSAAMGGAMMAGLSLAGKGLSAGNKWARAGKPEPVVEPMPDRFSDTVDGAGEINSPGEAAYRQPNVFDNLAKDSVLNAQTRANTMMQKGASKKEADAATKRSPELEAAMEAVRQRRESAKESFGRGVQQGEWLGPEEPRGPIEIAVEAAGTDLVKAAEQRNTQRRIQAGEADPKLLAALGLTTAAGMAAVAFPEEAKQVASGAGLAGALLVTGGRVKDAFPLRTLGGELAQGKYTLKTLERLPQNRTEIPKSMIEQELKRADVSKAEKDVLTEVLATKGEQVTAQELVRDFRLATGDHTLEAKATGEYADYGLDRIDRMTADSLRNIDREAHPGDPGAHPTTTLYRLPEHMELSDANHFQDPRLFGWTRSFEEGGVKHVVEVQSDLAQHTRGLKPGEREALVGHQEDLQTQIQALNGVHTAEGLLSRSKTLNSVNPDLIMFIEDRINDRLLPDQVKRFNPEGRQSTGDGQLLEAISQAKLPPRDPVSTLVANAIDSQLTPLRLRYGENAAKLKSAAAGSQLSPMLKHWPRRLIREEMARTAQEGGDVVRFATADTVAKVEGWPTNEARLERLQSDRADLQKNIDSVDRYYTPEQRAQVKEDIGKSLQQVEKDIADFKPGFRDPGHQSIHSRYRTDIETYLKGLGGKEVVDASGHSWIEVPTKAHAGRVQQYGKADPKLLAAMGVVGGGVLVGGLLAGDSKVAGAILGGVAGAGLLRLPRTLAGLGKTISPKQVAWNAARVGAVLGVGTYLGGKSGDPVYGAAVAAAIILGKNALPAAKKLTTDQFISLRNGNIAAQQRITDNMIRDINAAVPDPARRVAIAEALDAGSTQGLAPKELQVYRYVRQFLDTLGKEAQDASVIKGMRQNYVSYIVERDPLMSLEQESGILQKIFESSEGGSSGSPNTRFGKRGKYETFDEINAALKGSGLKLKTQDIGEIVGLYTKSMRTAIENKLLLDTLKKAKTDGGMDYLVRADKNGNLPPGYEKLNHPQLTGYGVQAELVDSLKTVMNNSDPNVVTRGLHGLSMAVKRVQVFGSMFHAKSLMEVYINSMGKDFYSTKTGVNMAPINVALKMYREGGLGDTLDIGIRNGLSMQIPMDVSKTIIGDIGKGIDAITPRLIGKELKIGTAVTDKIDWVNGKMDKLTWDYLHAGIKGAVFLKEFETMMLRNAEAHARNPKIPLKSRELIAKEVATYANDLTGGLNWFQIAADSKTQLGRNLGMYFAGPEGQRFAQMLAFAPDWAVSTLRAGFKAFGESDRTLRGLWKPENATDLYRRYALRSTLYWLTLLNGINLATSGHSMMENKDPTRIEFEDGTSMQAGKHTFEAVHAATDPVKFAYNKLGFTPKMLIDLASGKSGYGDTAPKYDNYAGHVARTALPFTVNTATQPGITGVDRGKRAVLSSIGLPVYGTTPEQKMEVKIQRAADRERKRGVRKEWGGKE